MNIKEMIRVATGESYEQVFGEKKFKIIAEREFFGLFNKKSDKSVTIKQHTQRYSSKELMEKLDFLKYAYKKVLPNLRKFNQEGYKKWISNKARVELVQQNALPIHKKTLFGLYRVNYYHDIHKDKSTEELLIVMEKADKGKPNPNLNTFYNHYKGNFIKELTESVNKYKGYVDTKTKGFNEYSIDRDDVLESIVEDYINNMKDAFFDLLFMVDALKYVEKFKKENPELLKDEKLAMVANVITIMSTKIHTEIDVITGGLVHLNSLLNHGEEKED